MSDLEDLGFDPQEYADQLGYSDELGRGDYSDPNVVRAETPETRRRGVTRRELLVKGGLGAAALSASGAFAGSAAAKAGRGEASDAYTGTLRMISLGVEWPAGAQAQAEKDLGVKFNVQLLSTNAQVQKSITAPTSFDIGGLYNYQMFPIWPTGNFQPVDRTQITAWKDYYPLFTQGQSRPQRHVAHLRAGRRRVPRHLRRPEGLVRRCRQEHRPAAHQRRPDQQQAARPVVEREDEQAQWRQARAAVRDRRDRALQHGLDGLHR